MSRPTHGMMTLGRLAKLSGLARSSLLHYEALGLLKPAGRSAAGYRLYGETQLERLRSIRRYRDAGLSLAAIAEMLSPRKAGASRGRAPSVELLEARLLELSNEVERLRSQQRLLARLLAMPEFRAARPVGDKAAWSAMLSRAGFSEADMRQWHADFEAEHPKEHAAFLRALGLAATEVSAIRRWSRQ
jgi:MerR family transcriptional regulator, thiopeptide resistance regulator